MIIEILNQHGLEPRRKGSKDEYASPCPACGGRDRFIIHADTDRYWCRQCGTKGDSIQYLRDFHGMGYREALGAIRESHSQSVNICHHNSPKPAPKTLATDQIAWLNEAANLISFARQELGKQPEAQLWMKEKRGITPATSKRFSLGWIPENMYLDRVAWGLPKEHKEGGVTQKLFIPSGLLIPGPKRLRIRRDKPGKFGRYYVVPGSVMTPYQIGNQGKGTTAIIVESELDAFILAQEVSEEIHIVALGSTNASIKEKTIIIEKLKEFQMVFISFDSDLAGAKAARWWLENLHNTFRAPIPLAFGKDITEAFLNGLDLNLWLIACKEVHHATFEKTIS